MRGAEPFLVGLCPAYWSHAPLTIANIHRMKLVGGIHCLAIVNDSSPGSSGADIPDGLQFYPFSKCILVGTIVASEKRSNNSAMYVLDDGTGLVDCIVWNDVDGPYALPSLNLSTMEDIDEQDQQGMLQRPIYGVGDMVRVFGRVECLSVSEQKKDLRGDDIDGVVYEIRDCIREIHVSLIEQVAARGLGGSELDLEAKHWMTTAKALLVPDSEQQYTNNINDGIRNGNDVLDWLGPKIAVDVRSGANHPSADDTLGAWRLFGVSCRCNTKYKDALLYCHCQAKDEPLDPTFAFRDHLLCTLVDMEEALHGDDDRTPKVASPSGELRFQFKAMANNSDIRHKAAQVLATTENPASNVQHLIVATFRALRQDGILYLLDEKSDTYILISLRGILRPYTEKLLQSKRQHHNNRPSYLANVPSARLQYVKRYLQMSMGD